MNNTNQTINVKSLHGFDIRRFSLEQSCKFNELHALVGKLYKLEGYFVLRYPDEESDMITVTSDFDLQAAFSLVQKGKLAMIKLRVDTDQATKPTPATCKNEKLGNEQVNNSEKKEDSTVNDAGNSKKKEDPATSRNASGPRSWSQRRNWSQTHCASNWRRSQPTSCAAFVSEVNLLSRTEVLPSQTLVKTWQVRNNGSTTWDEGTTLVFLHGTLVSVENSFEVASALPSATINVSAVILTPAAPGRYRAVFRLQDRFGRHFGPKMWCDIDVVSELNEATTEVLKNELEVYKAAKKAAMAKAWQEMRDKKKAWNEMKEDWQKEWSEEAKKTAWQKKREEWRQKNILRSAAFQRVEKQASGIEVPVEVPVEASAVVDVPVAGEPVVVEVPKPAEEPAVPFVVEVDPAVEEPPVPAVVHVEPVAEAAQVPAVEAVHEPVEKFSAQLSVMQSMGFDNKELNMFLLQENRGDVERVLNVLFQQI